MQNAVNGSAESRGIPARAFPAGAAALLIAGAFLRSWHIAWGLPDVFEEATPFVRAWGIWHWGSPGLDFNPHFFNYPALTFLLHWVVQAAHFAAGRALGLYQNLEGFRVAYEQNPTGSIVIARLFNALCDLGTVFIVTLTGRRLAGPVAGLLAGALSSCNPLQIRLAQQINVDTPMTLFIAACLWFCLEIQSTGTLRAHVAAGVCAGLALACKYSAAPVIAAIVAAYLARTARPTPGRAGVLPAGELLIALAAAAGVFLLLNPWVILDPAAFRSGIAYEAMHVKSGHFGIAEDSSTATFYASEVLPGALGWTVIAAALAGTCVCWNSGARPWLIVMIGAVAFSSVLVAGRMRADRYLLPLVPFILLFAGTGASPAARGPRASFRSAWLAAAIAGTLLGESGWRALSYHRDAAGPDTRTLARDWIAARIPGESFIAMAPLGVTVTPPRQVLFIPYVAVGFERLAGLYDARWFVDLDLVIGSDFDRGRYAKDPARFSLFLRYFYDSLETRWHLAKAFGPDEHARGPRIWLYTPPDGPAPALFGDDLMKRLDSVRSPRALINFGWNLSAMLYHRGKPVKADQLWRRVAEIVLRDRNPAEVLTVMSDYPDAIRGDPRFLALMRALANREAEGH